MVAGSYQQTTPREEFNRTCLGIRQRTLDFGSKEVVDKVRNISERCLQEGDLETYHKLPHEFADASSYSSSRDTAVRTLAYILGAVITPGYNEFSVWLTNKIHSFMVRGRERVFRQVLGYDPIKV